MNSLDEENQIILVDKPAGMSSFGVVARVRRELTRQFGHKIKVGHTGTLDPFATGLLILLSGKMTKRSNEFLKLDKKYVATLRLGFTSTTGDPEGEITPYPTGTSRRNPNTQGVAALPRPVAGSAKPPLMPTEAEVLKVVKSFEGKITQTVPRFSAVKIHGQRAYQLARKGQDFQPPTREVEIYRLEVLSYNFPELEIKCHVSSGTYIRTLGEDIGKKLGTGAYLTSLRRLRVGDYDVKDAVSLSEKM